jgi:hypothetical protein
MLNHLAPQCTLIGLNCWSQSYPRSYHSCLSEAPSNLNKIELPEFATEHLIIVTCRSVEYLSKWFYDTSTDTVTRAVHCGLFVGEGLDVSDIRYGGIWWRQGFTWFGPSGRNTLRPREILCCIAVPSLKASVVPLVALGSAWAF